MTDATAPDGRRGPVFDLVRHTLVYGSGYVSMAIASFVLVPVYVHRMSASDYGLLGLMLVLYGLMSQVYDLGFTNSVGRFYFDRGASGERIISDVRSTGTAFTAAFGVLLTAVLMLAAPSISDVLTGTSDHADLVRIVAATLLAEGLAIVPLTLIRMAERSRIFVLITVTRFVVTLGLSVTFVVGFGWGVRGALLANTLSAAGVVLVLIGDFRLAARGRPSRRLLRQMLGFGLPFFPVLVSSWLIEASDRYLLGQYRSTAEVGYYVLGYKIAQVMQIALAAFSMGWAPLRYRISEGPEPQVVYRRLATYYTLAAAAISFAVAVFARPLVTLVAPSEYASAADIVPAIAFSYAINGLYIMAGTGMGIAKRTGPMAWIVGAASVVNFGVNLALIPVWGMRAAAATTVAANLLMCAGGWYWSQRVYPVDYDLRRLGIIAATWVGSVAAVMALAPRDGLASVATGAGALVVFLVFLTRMAPDRMRLRQALAPYLAMARR